MAGLPPALEDLFENAPCGYLVVGPDGRIMAANMTLMNWTGYSPAEIVGRRLQDIVRFPTKVLLETQVLPALRLRGSVDEVALELTTSTGDTLFTVANAAESRDPEGRHAFTKIILLKSVDRRRYERELVDARDRAEGTVAKERSLSELREQFIAVLGHDLRNPIASIAGGIHQLRKEVASERGLRALNLMQGSVARTTGLIDNVLDFARGRLGSGLTLERNPEAPFPQIIEQAVAELQAIAPDREFQVDLSVDQTVDCDASRIGQLASNLLGNAVTHGAKDQPIRVGSVIRNGELEFWVANGGRQIAMEALDNLFQPFFRGQVAPSQQGLGLGLYIASQIAKAHGGDLHATSTSDETRFTFTMPFANDPPVGRYAAGSNMPIVLAERPLR